MEQYDQLKHASDVKVTTASLRHEDAVDKKDESSSRRAYNFNYSGARSISVT